MKEKENALNDFWEMIQKSWTYEKMTDKEKSKLIELLMNERTKKATKGDYKTRYIILNAMYNAFLYGIGYDGFNWRSDSDLLF